MNDEELIQAYNKGIHVLIKRNEGNDEGTKVCQSCAMLLKTNEYLGTENDGSTSKDFCKYCYDKGNFVAEMTMDDLINSCAPTVAEHNSMDVKEVKKQMKEHFPTLKRWKK
jgi:hypothetical protein